MDPVGGDSIVTSATANNIGLNAVKVEKEEILPDSTEDVAMNNQLTEEVQTEQSNIPVKSTDCIKKEEDEPGQSLNEEKTGKHFGSWE